MLIAQLTDTHVQEPGRVAFGRLDNAALLAQAVEAILAFRPRIDALLLTGDLADAGRPAQYAQLRTRLAPLVAAGCPLLPIPGNHDDRDALRAAFADSPALAAGTASGDEFVQWDLRLGRHARLVGLDTLVPGADHGALCDHRLDWLDARLAREDVDATPVLLAMHHPPFDCGIGWMDRIGLRTGRERLAAILRARPQVRLVTCGHVHRTIQASVGGTRVVVAPSTTYALPLDLTPDGPEAWTGEPGGWTLHRLGGNGEWVTHTMALGRWPGPSPFD